MRSLARATIRTRLYGSERRPTATAGPGAGSLTQSSSTRRSEERRVGSDWSSDVCSSDLDAIFGACNYQNEIVWKRTTTHSDSRTWSRVADTIFFYTKIGRASCRE